MPKKRKFDDEAKAHLLKLCDEIIRLTERFKMESTHYLLKDDSTRLAIAELSATAETIRPRIVSAGLGPI